ncbi:Glucose-induced degradation protein 4-like [Oopsacas minuta]|uniref:Glucose-induced degradation protein 4-like n=1 Tax=Oopsacas minuta TaxID=111878 RepID=A0AAV7JMP8_9METZ|nr:Glucose-induced degradation protein 4-like [Oopsacas minuta]
MIRSSSTSLGYPRSLLYSGSKFEGHQQCKGNSYDIEVVLQHVDTPKQTLNGYLKIRGLASQYPVMTRFFEGEIISPKYPFLTRKWDADEEVDGKHWSKFPSFQSHFTKSFNNDDFDYSQLETQDDVYMRWKEQFLVPDHKVRDISGASFAGFYYISYQRSNASIVGYYFHRNSEWFQSLMLDHVPDRVTQVFQFK